MIWILEQWPRCVVISKLSVIGSSQLMASLSAECPDSMLARGEKRLQVLQKFQKSEVGIAMQAMRSAAASEDVVTPWGPHPETPSASPAHSKRIWEAEFYQYKCTSRRWALWWLAGLHRPWLSAEVDVRSTSVVSD